MRTVQATPQRTRPRLGSLLRAFLTLLAATLLAGCAGLRPLPTPHLSACPAGGSLGAFWSCLDRTDGETHAGITGPQPRESAFHSTSRVTNGDLGRKRRDQHPEKACGGVIPPGFAAWEAEPPAPGRAPLRAYAHPPQPGRATVIVVHGLYDSKHARYVRVTAELLARAGFGVVVPDMRFHGCNFRGWLPTMGVEEGRDLVAWASLVRARYPGSPLGLLGFSLGALDVLHALARDAQDTGTSGALAFPAGGIAVSPPANLPLTLARLDDPPSLADDGFQRFIGQFFQSALRTRMRDLGLPRAARPFDAFLAWLARQPPLPPGSTPATVLAAADPVPLLSQVQSPLLLVASRRDPIFFEGALLELRRASAGRPQIHLIETIDGGHIGQIGRYPEWSAELFTRFFAGSAGAVAEDR
jgi:predicted alpha/beta-fold hydrolase